MTNPPEGPDSAPAAVGEHLGVQVHSVVGGNGTTPFSPEGAAELERRLDLFLSDLVSECRRIARRHGADHISPAYVRQAVDQLVTRKRRRLYGLAGTFGSIVLGAAVSGMLSAANATPPNAPQLLATAGAGMAGAFAVALQFAVE